MWMTSPSSIEGSTDSWVATFIALVSVSEPAIGLPVESWPSNRTVHVPSAFWAQTEVAVRIGVTVASDAERSGSSGRRRRCMS